MFDCLFLSLCVCVSPKLCNLTLHNSNEQIERDDMFMCVGACRIFKSPSNRKLTIRNKIDLCAFYRLFLWSFVIKF